MTNAPHFSDLNRHYRLKINGIMAFGQPEIQLEVSSYYVNPAD